MTLQGSPNPPRALRMVVHSAALVYHPSSQCVFQAELTQVSPSLVSFTRAPLISSQKCPLHTCLSWQIVFHKTYLAKWD